MTWRAHRLPAHEHCTTPPFDASVDPPRLQASEMGCSHHMALGSTRRTAPPRPAGAARAIRTTANACNVTWRAHRLPAHEHCTTPPFGASVDPPRLCRRARWTAQATWRSAARGGPLCHGPPVLHQFSSDQLIYCTSSRLAEPPSFAMLRGSCAKLLRNALQAVLVGVYSTEWDMVKYGNNLVARGKNVFAAVSNTSITF